MVRTVLVVGIDENGLGPVLGPLVVTAVAFEVENYTPEALWQAAGSDLNADDSKKVFSSSKMGSAEIATLAWLATFGIVPVSYAELAERVTASPLFSRPCRQVPDYCMPSAIALPVWASPNALIRDDGEQLLASRGISPVRVLAFSLCPGVFNNATGPEGMNKFALDCRLMISLVKQLGAEYHGEVLALCGKVGSTRRYGPWLEDSRIGLWMPEVESKEVSTYRIVPYGRISFIRDGDASHLPIAVASMVGKYLRELAMRDINALLAAPGQRHASGYRDPVTARFIEQTEEVRKQMGIEPLCFLRNS
jgi:ribonuclease HII